MARTNLPIGMDAAIAKVRAKAVEWLAASTVKPAAWGRTFVEPEKNVYITLEKKEGLVAKWKGATAVDARFHHAGRFSADVTAQVDLKLQLNANWDTWKANTSPFAYHIPIDSYHSPEDIAAEKKAKEERRGCGTEESGSPQDAGDDGRAQQSQSEG